MSLTERQQRFVSAFLIEPNATKAAIAAGYAASSAHVRGAELVRNRKVSDAISKANEKRAEKHGISADRVLSELAKIAFQDIRKAVQWRSNVTTMGENNDGEPMLVVSNEVIMTDSAKLDDDTAGAIAEIAQSDKGSLRIKMHDKRAALVDLGKHLGLFNDKDLAGSVIVEIRDLRSPRVKVVA